MKKFTVIALIAITLFSCTKQASNQLASEDSKKAKGHIVLVTDGVTAGDPILTANGDGTFTVDYNTTDTIVYCWFKFGDLLSASGNVIQSGNYNFTYPNAPTIFNYTGAAIYKQMVITVGSLERDANGILGTNWVTRYSNVVQ